MKLYIQLTTSTDNTPAMASLNTAFISEVLASALKPYHVGVESIKFFYVSDEVRHKLKLPRKRVPKIPPPLA